MLRVQSSVSRSSRPPACLPAEGTLPGSKVLQRLTAGLSSESQGEMCGFVWGIGRSEWRNACHRRKVSRFRVRCLREMMRVGSDISVCGGDGQSQVLALPPTEKRGKMAAEEAAAATTTTATATSAWAADEDEVAEEELRLLEAMTAVSTSMQQVRRRPRVLASGGEESLARTDRQRCGPRAV